MSTSKEVEINRGGSSKSGKRRKLNKLMLFRFIFCSISILFIIGCFIFYGLRLIKYYKIYNPKTETGETAQLLGNYITAKSSIVYDGDGLYKVGNGYIYKGKDVDNYITFSGLNWRIIRIGTDDSVDVMLEDYINVLKWNNKVTNYSESDISKYLNDKFLSMLDQDSLAKTAVCNDSINNVKDISCKVVDSENYVRLLNINEFLNSKLDSSFISDNGSIWLANHGDDKVWSINANSVSYAEPTELYEVRPVITLRSSNVLKSGTGTKEDPYIIKEKDSDNKLTIGKHVKIADDYWTIYEVNEDSMKLASSVIYTKMRSFGDSTDFDTKNSNSLANYLNNDLYESLSYKKDLVDSTWYVGEYINSYKDINSKKVTAKVGLLSIADLKFDADLSGYYLLNGNGDKIYLYSDEMLLSKPTLSRVYRPAISIKKLKVKSGTGTTEDPYVLEA